MRRERYFTSTIIVFAVNTSLLDDWASTIFNLVVPLLKPVNVKVTMFGAPQIVGSVEVLFTPVLVNLIMFSGVMLSTDHL